MKSGTLSSAGETLTPLQYGAVALVIGGCTGLAYQPASATRRCRSLLMAMISGHAKPSNQAVPRAGMHEPRR